MKDQYSTPLVFEYVFENASNTSVVGVMCSLLLHMKEKS